MDEARSDYRNWLVKAHHEASKDFDKAIITLSGGALGLSLAFVKQIAPQPIRSSSWMMASWLLFSASLLAILFSFLTSQATLKNGIKSLDNGGAEGWTGLASRATVWLNYIAALTLVAGVIALITFAWFNTAKEVEVIDRKESAATQIAPSSIPEKRH